MGTTEAFPAKSLTSVNVILVDDNQQFRDTISKYLKMQGADVTDSADAGCFLTQISGRNANFDLAIIDIKLPGLDGDEIITWLQNSEDTHVRDLPVIVVTGFPGALPETIVPNGKNIRLLAKPFGYAELLEAVTALTTNRVANVSESMVS